MSSTRREKQIVSSKVSIICVCEKFLKLSLVQCSSRQYGLMNEPAQITLG